MGLSDKQKSVGEFYDFLKYGLETDDPAVSRHLMGLVGITEADLANERVLEVGIGRGNWAMFLSKYAKTYVGADLSMDSLKHVRRKYGANLARADITSLPIPTASFDRVFGIGVLPAVEHHREGFRELARALKPGGKIHLFCYGQVHPRNEFRDLVSFALFKMSRDKQRKACYKMALMAKYPIPESVMFRSDMEYVQLDWYLVPVQHRHTYRQIADWMAEENIDPISFSPYPHPSKFLLHRAAARTPILERFVSPDFFALGVKKG